MNLKVFGGIALLFAAMSLTGCTTARSVDTRSAAIATPAAAPTRTKASPAVVSLLKCINESGDYHGIPIAVALWSDGTGKENAVAPGATGKFLPQSVASTVMSAALLEAGAIPLNRYENNTLVALNQFGGEEAKARVAQNVNALWPRFTAIGYYTSLDFSGGPTGDVRGDGIGPFGKSRAARVGFAAELVEPASGAVYKTSEVERKIRFTEIGVSSGRLFGATLFTGKVSFSDQQMMQAESLQDPIGLMTADLLIRQSPKAKKVCGDELEEVLPSKPSV